MNILIIDDNKTNQDSARKLEQDGHIVTVLGTVEEAYYFLSGNKPTGRYDKDPNWKVPDVVLTDLWMPAPAMKWDSGCERVFGVNPYHPEQDTNRTAMIPAGLVFAIAASNLGVKLVAILTDSDHHKDQMVATMDLIAWHGFEGIYSGIRKFEARYFRKKEDEEGPKDWGKLLKKLLREPKT